MAVRELLDGGVFFDRLEAGIVGDSTIAQRESTRVGYTFLGWNVADNFGGEQELLDLLFGESRVVSG
jgi:hypothetical protein